MIHDSPNRLALISTPWPFFDRPSIQMGTLKAFLNENHPHVGVVNHHFYLRAASALGYETYRAISERKWIAECPYAALLQPDRIDTVARFWKRRVRGNPLLEGLEFRDLCKRVESVSLSLVEKEPWRDYSLIGLSISLAQLTSSIFFIREIRRRAPDVPVVVGGSACAGDMGEGLLRIVPQIDYVVAGEGEIPLLKLTKGLTSDAGYALKEIPGLMSRDAPQYRDNQEQMPDLDELPIPDYSDYFKDLESLGPGRVFLPALPVEMSRGCWWTKGAGAGGKGGCTFCNLNLQWSGYRQKGTVRMVQEIDTLIKRHRLLSVSFMDNLLPARGLEQLFSSIGALGRDLRMFAEVRARTRSSVLETMAAAGMEEIQVGIEALSTSLLRKFNKGTRAIDNLEIMKNCERAGMPDLSGNLILDFPASDSEDVAETLKNLDFAFPFRPLRGIALWLGYGSPLWRNPGQCRIRLRGNHPWYGHIFPSKEFQNVRFMIQAYAGGRGGVRRQRRLWEPVREKLKEWRGFYGQMHRGPGFRPILSYRDGKDFLIIRERRLNKDITHRLKGDSRALYLYCGHQRSMARILARFPRFSEDQIQAFLRMMVEKRLMFNEGDRYLSLAVPHGSMKTFKRETK
ncbi:MAG: RiPP maturation radical SAM C-methyltransferase [Deltaproteobacteria bacterium]|nr:RiPP maturation radical SAM C-methyltransferase [Deltaproteobacteria bacterium]